MASINERKAFRLSVIFILLIAVIACMIIARRNLENIMVG